MLFATDIGQAEAHSYDEATTSLTNRLQWAPYLNFEPNLFLAEYVTTPMWQLHHELALIVLFLGSPPAPELPTQRQ